MTELYSTATAARVVPEGACGPSAWDGHFGLWGAISILTDVYGIDTIALDGPTAALWWPPTPAGPARRRM